MQSSVTDFLSMANNEKVIRDYHALTMNMPAKMDGRIVVTNERVILYGTERRFFGASRAHWVNEIHIDKVKGTDVLVSYIYNIAQIVAGIFLIILAFFLMIIGDGFSEDFFIFIIIILFIAGIALILTSLRKTFWVNIKAEHIPGIEIGGTKRSLQIMGTKAGPDAVQLAQEIGALIIDVQKNPDAVLRRIHKHQKKVDDQAPPPPPTEEEMWE